MIIKAEWTNKDSLDLQPDLQPTCNQLATTEGEFINRADAIKCIKWGEDVTDVIGRIKALPSADRPTGEWIKSDILPNGWHCSHCDAPVMTDDIEEMLFCPHCGSEMGVNK